jgi:hypothetical protein
VFLHVFSFFRRYLPAVSAMTNVVAYGEWDGNDEKGHECSGKCLCHRGCRWLNTGVLFNDLMPVHLTTIPVKKIYRLAFLEPFPRNLNNELNGKFLFRLKKSLFL